MVGWVGGVVEETGAGGVGCAGEEGEADGAVVGD